MQTAQATLAPPACQPAMHAAPKLHDYCSGAGVYNGCAAGWRTGVQPSAAPPQAWLPLAAASPCSGAPPPAHLHEPAVVQVAAHAGNDAGADAEDVLDAGVHHEVQVPLAVPRLLPRGEAARVQRGVEGGHDDGKCLMLAGLRAQESKEVQPGSGGPWQQRWRRRRRQGASSSAGARQTGSAAQPLATQPHTGPACLRESWRMQALPGPSGQSARQAACAGKETAPAGRAPQATQWVACRPPAAATRPQPASAKAAAQCCCLNFPASVTAATRLHCSTACQHATPAVHTA